MLSVTGRSGALQSGIADFSTARYHDVMNLTSIALRAAAFACGLGMVFPCWAQTTPVSQFPPSQTVDWPLHTVGGAVRLYDINGNVIGGATHPMMVECPDGTVNCFSGGGGGGGSGFTLTDEAAFTAGTSSFGPVGGFYQATATSNALTDGQSGSVQVTANRALFSNLRDASGTEVGTASTPLQVSLANTAANSTAVKVTGTLTAGSAIIGKVGIDQTTPGTTNLVAAGQNGTWTVQPGNTANTTAWKVDGSGVTQPVSGTVTANAGTNLNTSLLALESGGNLATLTTDFGAPGATACATDTASCNLNQQAQRLAQRLTTINTTLGTPIQATGGTVGLVAGTALAGKFGIDQTTPGTTNGVAIDQTTDGTTNAVHLKAGTALAGKFGIDQTTPGTTNGVSMVAAAAGGASSYHLIAAASDNHAVVKNGAGTVYGVQVSNSGTVADYIRLYDAGTGFSGCNSATNVVWGMAIPAPASASGVGGGFVADFTVGKAFATGIAICVTGTGATPSDTDTANAHTTTVVNIGYK